MSKIISVNGNKAMNFLLQTIFENTHDFIPVSDVFQAMQCLKPGHKVSALIVDVDFQPQQNWDFVQHIKSSKLFNIPVVILASENTELLKIKSYELEVDEIFYKPFNPLDLVLAIKELKPAEALAGA
jgi:two-component system, chemotaxis family, chemotaxis protein CheY